MNPSSYKDSSYTLLNNVVYRGEIDYLDGPIKNDNLGNPYPTGQIKGGTLTVSISITAARPVFAYAKNNNTIPTVSEIRSHAIYSLGATKGSTARVVGNETDQSIIFAYPASLGDCNSIRYEELNDAHNETAFEKVTMPIPALDGSNPIDYIVYYWCAPKPFGGEATLVLTI